MIFLKYILFCLLLNHSAYASMVYDPTRPLDYTKDNSIVGAGDINNKVESTSVNNFIDVNNLKLSGIIFYGASKYNLVIINDVFYKVGQEIKATGIFIKNIEKNKVVLINKKTNTNFEIKIVR